MGGGFYDEDVALDARANQRDVFTYRGYGSAAEASARRGVHPELNPHGKIRECKNDTPIVVAMDVTRSRGNDARIMYDKLPRMRKSAGCLHGCARRGVGERDHAVSRGVASASLGAWTPKGPRDLIQRERAWRTATC